LSPEIIVEQGKAVVVETQWPQLKCKYCECLFCFEVDRKNHLSVCPNNPVNRSRNMWHKYKKGGPGQWAYTSEDPQLKTALLQHGGRLLMAGFNVSLDPNGVFFDRRPAGIE
jgi:hypothetical protein